MIYQSIVIITPRLCAILSKTDVCAHIFISWNPVLPVAFHSEHGTIPSVPLQLE